jgi:putative SOS response-associated peptidase YedK
LGICWSGLIDAKFVAMCGLYSLTRSPQETRAWFKHANDADYPPRPHVAPGQPIGVVRMDHGERRFALVRWGFVPAWQKEIKPGKPPINARGETALEKPTFRNAMRRRRCLVPADGFYEWSGEAGHKTPHFFSRPDHGLFAFAGLWEHWMGADGSELETGALMTISPNAEVAAIHDRMPVIIQPQDYEVWLTGAVEDAARLIRPAPDGTFSVAPTTIARGRAATADPPRTRVRQLDLF